MAAVNPAQTVQTEATCPICLEYFDNPVSLGCDHNFCRACITHCWDGSQTLSCPQCRRTFPRRKLKPNRLLRNIVEAARGLKTQAEREAEDLCEKHREPLKLFCKEDEVPICLVCDTSKEHRDHTVIPADEAAEEYKEKIQGHLKTLREEKEKLVKIELNGEKRYRENFSKSETEMAKIEYLFDNLNEFLDGQLTLLLSPLQELEYEIMYKSSNYSSRFLEEISCLSNLISEVEGKCEKPPSEFLQDVRSILSSCGKRKFQEPEVDFPEFEKLLSDMPQKIVVLRETIKTFKDTLSAVLERKGLGSLGSQDKFAVTVTLDPETAHPELIISQDGRSVRCPQAHLDDERGGTQQELLENPERFDTSPCVLGRERFASGRHSWEVEVDLQDGQDWAVGVAKASVKRKGEISPSSEVGIWAVRRSEYQFCTFSSSQIPLPDSWIPRKIRVCLDFYREQVTFVSADDEAPIFTLPLDIDAGERLRPWFWVGRQTRFRLCP